MRELFKYAIVLSFGVAVGSYLHGSPSLEGVGKLKWFDEINVIINKAFVPRKPEAAFAPVDPAAATLIDEELDYRVAQRIGSLEGWRSFLAAHGKSAYAQSARAEVEKLLPPGRLPRPPPRRSRMARPRMRKLGARAWVRPRLTRGQRSHLTRKLAACRTRSPLDLISLSLLQKD